MIVVSNTSPILNLSTIGRLSILGHLYGRVLVPEAVWQELESIQAERGETESVLSHPWLETRSVVDRRLVGALRAELDPGEAEAIVLAIEVSADLVLIDERKARGAASRFGLRYIGLLGVLIDAKHRGIIPSVKDVLDRLIVDAGFWVSAPLYARVLNQAGE